jgi:hypothetical protein
MSFSTPFSASARISKGQGYKVFLRKRAGSSFCQKWAICVVQGKLEALPFGYQNNTTTIITFHDKFLVLEALNGIFIICIYCILRCTGSVDCK